jgi:hypothetical protein
MVRIGDIDALSVAVVFPGVEGANNIAVLQSTTHAKMRAQMYAVRIQHTYPAFTISKHYQFAAKVGEGFNLPRC